MLLDNRKWSDVTTILIKHGDMEVMAILDGTNVLQQCAVDTIDGALVTVDLEQYTQTELANQLRAFANELDSWCV